jgi:hypothetical protein
LIFHLGQNNQQSRSDLVEFFVQYFALSGKVLTQRKIPEGADSDETVADILEKFFEFFEMEFFAVENLLGFIIEMGKHICPFGIVPLLENFCKIIENVSQFLDSPFLNFLHFHSMMAENY